MGEGAHPEHPLLLARKDEREVWMPPTQPEPEAGGICCKGEPANGGAMRDVFIRGRCWLGVFWGWWSPSHREWIRAVRTCV